MPMKDILLTFLVAMVPVVELRGAIPFGVVRGLNIWTAIIASVLGNLVPVPFIILFIRRIFAWMRAHMPKLDGLVTRMEKKAEKNRAAVEKYAFWGLAILVAIPLPGTGAWTGALVAAMREMRLKRAFPAIVIGVVIAGVIVSVLSSWLVWMLMLGEMPLAASKSGIFPKMFVKENKNGSPSTSLLWTTIVVQVVLIISFFIGNNAWTTMISITSVMALPCYFFCTLFLFKIAVKKEYPSGIFASRGMAVFTGAAGSLYGLWLIYAAGLNYLMVACIVYAIGLPLYIVGVRQHDRQAKLFEKRSDKVILAVVLALGIAGLIYSVITFGNIHI